MNTERARVVRQMEARLEVLRAEEAKAQDHLNCLRGGIAEIEFVIEQLDAKEPDAEEPVLGKPEETGL